MYIDDLSELEAIEQKKQLICDPVTRHFPLNYHEGTQQILPPGGILQKHLDKVEQFTTNNQMKIKASKSKVIIFNKSRKYDFPPEMTFQYDEILECLEETNLLGIQISSSLKWDSNTSAICEKAMSKMWLLRRIKIFKLEPDVLFDYYIKEIRPLVEQGVPIWNSGLTKAQVNLIENIQKVSLKIILGNFYTSYKMALTLCSALSLEYRRTDLSTNFTIKLYKSPRSKDYFEPATKLVNTRNDQQLLVMEKKSNTKRCQNAPHNYLARLMNKNKTRIEKMKS